MAKLLGMPASRLCDVRNGKTCVSMTLSKKLYKQPAIPVEFILETA